LTTDIFPEERATVSEQQNAINAVLDRIYWWNRKDGQRCSAALHPDVEYDLRGAKPFQLKGRDNLASVIEPWLQRMPDNKVIFRNIIWMGSQVVTEMESPEIDLETGERRTFAEINFWEIKDGMIYRLISYRMDPRNMVGAFERLTDDILAGKYKDDGRKQQP
jgi:hypothetical protein